MLIFHISTVSDWTRAQADGAYTTSTRGRTLEQEGFLHAARREQVRGVFERYYADLAEPLVLLTVDTDRLEEAGVPWREDAVGDDRYPHVYGALPPAAVVRVTPMTRNGVAASFTELFLREALVAAAWLLGAMLLAALGVVLGRATGTAWGPFLGGVVGLVVGGAVAVLLSRRRGRR
ncbi:DUF952 domain-containing protein [Nocardioides zeae]|uniref:DUF952 domain-containing protein n=1 Tax=Nocardioides imazamoxiresistens TaxID=3231893 RepID=A0ABU3Q256_9ACTN|nr:DUF952 domain-containing protein [Nocardioides zeae]MDT9595122.1 DUF952 domain-containing protein [Nocardioides zeae]